MLAFDSLRSASGSRKADRVARRVELSSGETRSIQVLQRGIGVFWVLAGILQFQPLMFTPDFYEWYPSSIMESTIQTAADDQPHWVVGLVHFGSTVWATHPIVFNVLAATLQLCIGLLLMFGRGRTARVGIGLSITWGFIVWSIAEAFGGVFGGSTYFDGFPGAAALYVISSLLLLLFHLRQNKFQSLRTVLRYLVTVYWFAAAYLQVRPSSGFWDPSGLMEPFANEAAQPGPAVLARPVQWFALFTQSHTGMVNLTLILLMLLMAFFTLLNLWNWVTITVGIVWLAWSWWFGQGFGAVFTGAGTDPNSIPVIALWMAYLWLPRFSQSAKQKTTRDKAGATSGEGW